MARKKNKSKSDALAKRIRGDKPVFNPLSKLDWVAQFTSTSRWYDLYSSDKAEKKMTRDGMKLSKKYNFNKIEHLHPSEFKRFGRYFDMIENGFGESKDEWLTERIDSRYDEMMIEAENPTKKIVIVKKSRKNPHDRLMKKTSEKIGDILHIIDDFIFDIDSRKKKNDSEYFNAVSWAHKNELGGKHIRIILGELREDLRGYTDALNDEEIRSGYLFTDSQIKRIIRMYEMIIDDLSSLYKEKKTARKPRARKIKSPSQIVQSVKYLPETDEFGGLKSVMPVKIIESDLVVLLNIKYRKISVYRSADKDGMSVKGTTIIGFDIEKSFEKRIRESYLDDVLAVVKTQGIRAIKKEIDGINAKNIVPTGRINGDCVILKVK